MPEIREATSEVSELSDLVKRYVLQETVEPLKNVGRTLGYGTSGALLGGIGTVLVLAAVLRVLQTETGTVFTGSLTWVPYLLTTVVGVIVVALAAALFLREPRAERSLRTVDARRPESP